MTRLGIWSLLSLMAWAGAGFADTQTWNDAGVDNTWSTNAANWDAGSLWTNGNSAVFSGAGGTIPGETVEISNDVIVTDITFQTNGYVIADADNDGTFILSGAPVIDVTHADNVAEIHETIAGSVGFTKTGAGTLLLTATNTYSGPTVVSSGLLKLSPGILQGLGATGTGNGTEIASGATIDLNGSYKDSSWSEAFTVSGSGVDGKGALINTGAGHVNKSIGTLTMADDIVIGGTQRLDAYTIVGNNHTLVKAGAGQLCTKVVQNAEIVINEGRLTILDNNQALGGTTPGDTTVNGGTLDCWNTYSIPERITFNGGTLSEGNTYHTFYLTGHLTLNNNVNVSSSGSRGVEVSGFVDGAGGFTQANDGWFIVTGETNAYTGPTIVASGKKLWVGRTNLYAGVLGSSTVTNYGTLYAYSPLITKGSIVNSGSLNSYTGLLCNGRVINNGTLYFERSDAITLTNAFSGGGTTYWRFGPSITLDGSVSTNGGGRMGDGTLTLTNGASFLFTSEIQVADRYAFAVDPTNVTAAINVNDGCSLTVKSITFGNGSVAVTGGSMTGILNQVGGLVHTTGTDGGGEGNGIRLGHYPQAYCVYNMMGGTLIIDANADLGCATDGQGWFNMTGGEVFTTRVMLNERTGSGGKGRFTLAGGVLNLGTLNAEIGDITNAITADAGAPYTVEYGGAGGTVRAVTNVFLPLNATVYGSGTNAITFDSQEHLISLSGTLSGEGGFNKAGSGTLALSGTNTCTGATCVAEGRLLLGAANALTGTAVTVASGAALDLGGFGQALAGVGGAGVVSNGVLAVTGAIEPGTNGVGTLTLATGQAGPVGGTLVVDVTTAGESDLLQVEGDLDLTGTTLQIVDPEQLNTHQHYTIATFTGSLAGTFSSTNLTRPWYVMHDRVNQRVQVRADNGTLIKVR